MDHLRAADLILHGGDLSSVAFLEELVALGPPVRAIHGNADEPALKETLPSERVVEAEGARIAMVHNAGPRAGREARLAVRFPDCHAVVYGHTHVAQVERFQHLWILNPGSPTDRRRAVSRSMVLVRAKGETLRPELVQFT